MKLVTLILSLALAMPAMGTTVVVPVSDLLFEVPQFSNAPKFDLNQALNGTWTPQSPRKVDRKSQRKSQREIERKLLNFLWEEYPDALSIRIWRGNAIIKLPK